MKLPESPGLREGARGHDSSHERHPREEPRRGHQPSTQSGQSPTILDPRKGPGDPGASGRSGIGSINSPMSRLPTPSERLVEGVWGPVAFCEATRRGSLPGDGGGSGGSAAWFRTIRRFRVEDAPCSPDAHRRKRDGRPRSGTHVSTPNQRSRGSPRPYFPLMGGFRPASKTSLPASLRIVGVESVRKWKRAGRMLWGARTLSSPTPGTSGTG